MLSLLKHVPPSLVGVNPSSRSLYKREVKEGGREKVEELEGKVDKLEEEKAVLEKAKES